jgi:hypothetical protein
MLAARTVQLEYRVIVTPTPGDDPEFVAILPWGRGPDVLRCEAANAQHSGIRLLVAADFGTLPGQDGDCRGRLQRHHRGSLGGR